jgi:hypothetical protein
LQSIPYIASVWVSLVSAFPRLPASIVGPMGEMVEVLDNNPQEPPPLRELANPPSPEE